MSKTWMRRHRHAYCGEKGLHHEGETTTPLDDETLRLFIQAVAPRLRSSESKGERQARRPGIAQVGNAA